MAESRLEEARKSLKRIQEFSPESLSRREDLGAHLTFEAAIDPAKRIIALFSQIPETILSDLSSHHLTVVRDQANSIFNQFNEVLAFSVDNFPQGNIQAERTNRISSIENAYNSAFDQLMPIISYAASRVTDFARLEQQGRSTVQGIIDETSSLIEELKGSKDQAEKILNTVREVAAEHGVSQQAVYFKEEAGYHEVQAEEWLGKTWRYAIGFSIFAGLSLFLHKIPFLTPANSYETVQIAITKFLIFGILGLLLFLSVKNYLAHRHNFVLNRHRQNALLTYRSLADAAQSPENRDVILTQAAASIFSIQSTAYDRSGTRVSASPLQTLVEVFKKEGKD